MIPCKSLFTDFEIQEISYILIYSEIYNKMMGYVLTLKHTYIYIIYEYYIINTVLLTIPVPTSQIISSPILAKLVGQIVILLTIPVQSIEHTK